MGKQKQQQQQQQQKHQQQQQQQQKIEKEDLIIQEEMKPVGVDPKLAEQIKQEELLESKQYYECMGLVFHNYKVVKDFCIYTAMLIILPIGSFFMAKNQFVYHGFDVNQAYIYSGFIAAFFVNVVMIAYCWKAVKDPENYRHEQRQQQLLTKDQKQQLKEENLQKLKEPPVQPVISKKRPIGTDLDKSSNQQVMKEESINKNQKENIGKEEVISEPKLEKVNGKKNGQTSAKLVQQQPEILQQKVDQKQNPEPVAIIPNEQQPIEKKKKKDKKAKQLQNVKQDQTVQQKQEKPIEIIDNKSNDLQDQGWQQVKSKQQQKVKESSQIDNPQQIENPSVDQPIAQSKQQLQQQQQKQNNQDDIEVISKIKQTITNEDDEWQIVQSKKKESNKLKVE